MKKDTLSSTAKVKQLKTGLFNLTGDVRIKRSKNMGELLNSVLDFVIRNYKNENPYIIK
jgi:hypothetical protein